MSENEISTANNFPALANPIIAGNYKLVTVIEGLNLNEGKREFVIEWLSSKSFVSVFVSNYVGSIPSNKLFGISHFWAGDDVIAYSTSLSKCSGDVYDTGFYALT